MDHVDIAGVHFPLYTAAPGPTEAPAGEMDGQRMSQRAANNLLWLVDPWAALPGWRRVACRPRWNWLSSGWHRNDGSVQRQGERRWWGRRHHIRIWQAPGHAIGQAHYEAWHGVVPRRHRVLSLDQGRDAAAAAALSAGFKVHYVAVASVGPGWDGRVAVITA